MDGLFAKDGLFGVVVVALISAGGAKYLFDAIKDWSANKRDREPQAIRMRQVDQSMLSIAKARDELAEDLDRERKENARLRQAMADQELQSSARETALRAEVQRLDDKIRQISNEFAEFRFRSGL